MLHYIYIIATKHIGHEALTINYLLYIQSLFLNFTSWLPNAISKKDYLTRDIIAGITIAMIIIPQSMARLLYTSDAADE